MMKVSISAKGQEIGINWCQNGFRRISPAMITTTKTAEGFAGLLAGEGSPWTILATFKAAAPYLGLSHRAVNAIDWLFQFTQRQDWEEGARPIVWPSAAMQADALSLSLTRVKALNRYLIESGLVAMKDSPNGKRYGRRNKNGDIIEAYGFDLSPLAVRREEFRALAESGRETRKTIRYLRRRASVASIGLQQIAATASEYRLLDSAWAEQVQEAQKLAFKLARTNRLDELRLGVLTLEERQKKAREKLETLLPQNSTFSSSYAVDTDPKGSDSGPHNTDTNQTINSSNTVYAREGSAGASGENKDPSSWKNWNKDGYLEEAKERLNTETNILKFTAETNKNPGDRKIANNQSETNTTLRITPDELLRLAPRLKTYLAKPTTNWPEIVEAADWLRQELGISKLLWGEACLTMGREHAAIALAIVSSKPAGYFRGSPGGYYHGMVAKARSGDLNLARTIWGMRFTVRTRPDAWKNLPA
jgi:replication initiation protein RepC